jgi:hypothetical protein
MAGEPRDAKHQTIREALNLIFQGIRRLEDAFPNRRFTIDGRLVGDIGEIIAELEYDVLLDEKLRPGRDGVTSDGRNVQIKATFKDSLTFGSCPDRYLGFKLYENGDYKEIFNGPGKLIFDHYRDRKDIGVKLLSFSVADLQQLSQQVKQGDRIQKRRRSSIA